MARRVPLLLRFLSLALGSLAVSSPAALAFQAPANDDCASATPIAGDGAFMFNTAAPGITTSLPPLPPTCPGCTCSTTFSGIANDLWFIWTASCTGLVQMKTGDGNDPPGQCNLDTVLAVYNTPCPGTNLPIVCCDDTCAAIGNTCDLASLVRFDAICGHRYLIRVGMKPGTPGGIGTLKIACQGAECPPPVAQACADCCGTKPQYDDPFYRANYTGQVAVLTGNDDTSTGSAYHVVEIVNLECANPPPVPGQEWNPAPGTLPPSTSFRYSRDDWTKAKLGSVFGTTLDDRGNIYVAHASFYGILNGITCLDTATAIGGIGSSLPDTSTSVYQISAGSGVPQVFVNLPGGSTNAADPGLGNLTFDCQHEEFFVSHFGNGFIYRIARNGTILGWFHHASGAIGLGSGPAGPFPNFAPLGERVWAVQAHAGRLYYSVWGQNKDVFTPTAAVGTTPNRVWSIAIDGAGNFTGAPQQEIQTPVYPGVGNPYMYPALGVSAPISDISFSPDCRMLLAERDMSRDNCTLGHGARALEYVYSGAAWIPTTNFRGGLGYEIGQVAGILGTNSAGGCDYDFNATDPSCTIDGRVWVSGDALVYNGSGGRVYGMAGMLTTTPFGSASSIFIDYNSFYANGSFDKSKQGDVEVPCKSCMMITDERLLCDLDPTTQCYTYTFTVTNNAAATAYYILLSPPVGSPLTFSPNIIPLAPPLAPGQSRTVTTTICGASCPAGDDCDICFNITLVDQNIRNCCSVERCIHPPDCSCAQIVHDAAVCNTSGGYSFTFDIQNLTPSAVEHMFLFAPPGVTFSPTYFAFSPPLASGGVSPGHVITITGAVPGSTICFRISLHNHDMMQCCSFIYCVTLPTPCGGNPVQTQPGITLQPVSQTVNSPTPIVLAVAVSGSAPFTYEWRRGGVPLADGPNITGTDTSTLSITPTLTSDTGLYDVVVSNACCGSIVSAPALLDIYCRVDLNRDHAVSPVDIAFFVNTWVAGLQSGSPAADFDSNGLIEPADIAMYVNAWFGAINNGC